MKNIVRLLIGVIVLLSLILIILIVSVVSGNHINGEADSVDTIPVEDKETGDVDVIFPDVGGTSSPEDDVDVPEFDWPLSGLSALLIQDVDAELEAQIALDYEAMSNDAIWWLKANRVSSPYEQRFAECEVVDGSVYFLGGTVEGQRRYYATFTVSSMWNPDIAVFMYCIFEGDNMVAVNADCAVR